MNTVKTLEEKIVELEEQIKKLEETVASFGPENELMDAYYEKAKEIVIKNQKASVIFLQRKLLIDLDRSTQLLARLEKEGIIGPEEGFAPRKILVTK